MSRLAASSVRRFGSFVGLDGLHDAEDFMPIARAAVKEAERLISDIDRVTPGPEVVEVMDAISDSVCRVADVANFCYCIHPDDSWKLHSSKALQHLVQYISGLNTNEKLFHALDASLRGRGRSRDWTAEMEVVGRSLHGDFVNCGVGSQRSAAIQQIIAKEHQYGMQFQQCVTEHKEVQALSVKDPSVFPENMQEVTLEYSGETHVPMTPSFYFNIVRSVHDETTRRNAHMAHFGSLKDNVSTLEKLLRQRRLWAEALELRSFAHLKLKDSIAADPFSVQAFLHQTSSRIKEQGDEEVALLANRKGSAVYPWDVPYYIHEHRQEVVMAFRSKIFQEFDLRNVINGVARILLECMDIEMIQINPRAADVWDESVEVFVFRESGTDDVIGHLYLDAMSREKKRPENAHYTLRCGRQLPDGHYQTPIVALVTNFTSRKINFHELRTLLHEFGHVLHSLLSKTRFQHLHGTRGPLDLVEIPSHFFERCAFSPQALQRLAGADPKRHLPVPLESLNNLIHSQSLFSHLRMQEQLQLALFDQIVHSEEFHEKRMETADVMEEVTCQVGSVPFVPDTNKEAWLTHLTSYGARYYSYIYSRQIADMIWEQHIEEDVFNKQRWRFIRQHLFQPGGAMHPQMYVHNLIGEDRLVRHQQGWIPSL